MLELKLAGAGGECEWDTPGLPVFVANALETARTAVGVYAALVEGAGVGVGGVGGVDEAKGQEGSGGQEGYRGQEGISGGGYDRALRLAMRLVRLTSPSSPTSTVGHSEGQSEGQLGGRVEVGTDSVPAVLTHPAHASACLLLARVQRLSGGDSSARQTLDRVERAARAGGLHQHAHQAAALRAALGDTPSSITLPERLRLLATARKGHYPSVEKILCESPHL
jgi:hypothetical protein